ncbi:hypothetical protein Tco_0077991 [Tanacetum coccineum]
MHRSTCSSTSSLVFMVFGVSFALGDSTFSGGGDDEGSAAANSVMPAISKMWIKQTYQSQMPLYSQLEGTGSSVGTAEGSAEARCSSYSSSSSSFSTSSSSDDSLS